MDLVYTPLKTTQTKSYPIKIPGHTTVCMLLTNNDIWGAIIEPSRPNMEAMPNRDMRNSVGNISAVNTYIVLNAIVMANLLLRNNNSFTHKWSESPIHGVIEKPSYKKRLKIVVRMNSVFRRMVIIVFMCARHPWNER